MRHNNKLFILATALAASTIAAPAFAQRAPATGMWGLGASIGSNMPSDASLDNGLEVAANIENYLSPRVSIRAQVGGSSWDVSGRHFTGSVKPFRADGNIVYNWEGGAVHPYVTGGVGLYRFGTSFSGTADASDTRAGVNVGGGLEYFFERRATITGEALYHGVGTFNTPLASFKGSYWSLNVGVKAYLRP